MEPIRPDDDEVRMAADMPRKGASGSDSKKGKTPVRRPRSAQTRRHGAGVFWWLMLLLVAGAGAFGWYAQERRLDALQTQLEEADQWVRQSRLALARFEGELSETGENLQERGQTLEARIAANRQQLDAANTEIRKLWALADKRNRARLDRHEESLTALDSGLTDARQALTALKADLVQQLTQVRASLAGVEKQVAATVAALQERDRQLAGQLDTLTGQVAGADERIESGLRRFGQELKLTLDGLDSRLTVLEKRSAAAAGQKDVQALRQELSALARTVQSIDASRAQLTSRLVRLSDRLDRVETRMSGQ